MARRKISVKHGKALEVAAPSSTAAAQVYQKLLHKCQKGLDIFPLEAPGIPTFPGNSAFMRFASALGDSAEIIEETVENTAGEKKKVKKLVASKLLNELVQDALRKTDFVLPVEVGPHREKEARFVPGHIWQSDSVIGPRPAEVMIISKMPWKEEIDAQCCFAGDDGKLLIDLFAKARVDATSFYVTHLVKFMPPDWKTVLKAVWVNDCLPLLHQELKIVQPRFILCLGSDASKALLGSKASVTMMEGRVETLRYNIGYFPDHQGEEYWREAKVMTVVHPKQVLRDQSALRQLERGISRFCALCNGVDVGSIEKVDHTVVDNVDDLLMSLASIEADPEKVDDVIAVDAEWHGEHPVNKGSYVRTIQLAWMPKHAIGIKLYDAGGKVTAGFADPDNPEKLNKVAVEALTKFFLGGTFDDGNYKFRKKRVVGHFFNADLEWFVDFLHIDIRSAFACPLYDLEVDFSAKKASVRRMSKRYAADGFKEGDSVPAWYRTKYEGGADTGLMAHAIEETANYKLETLAMRYTTAPRYDAELDNWKTEYCRARGMQSSDLEGYGECPDDILLPYGMYDADVTLRLFYRFDVLLDEDYDGNNCREAFWESQIATPAVLEIHRTGITVDRARIDFLTSVFCTARNRIEEDLRSKINWPSFNIRSTQHVKELLFGHKLNGRVDKETGKPLRIRPEGAISLNLDPLFDTSKPPKPWIDVVLAKKTAETSPSTNKQVLSLLSRETPDEEKAKIVRLIRDYRFLDQVLKTILRPPETDSATDEAIRDDDGYMTYTDGLASMCCDDGKVRTHIYQTKETGRWASARPNLQNISKQRDPDYKRLLGEQYKYSLRSVLKASPGHVLVEADYVGAELFGMAVMSGDKTMIDHASRNQLPESDPNFYDIHSNVAVSAFKLDCPPTKDGLDSIGKLHIRIVAKSVIFGIAYGRGAKAIALAAKEQGTLISVDEAQAVINAIFNMYPRLQPFFGECQQRAIGTFIDPDTDRPVEHNYICNCYGRFRRFPDAGTDRGLQAEFQRQAMNFPIQSMIASAVSRAIAYLYDYKQRQLAKGKNIFNILLQIHDAILFEVPYKYVQHFCEYVLPKYMRDSVSIWPTSLDGMPTGDGPYHLGLEAEVMHHWGEKLKYEEAVQLGLPTGTGGSAGAVVKYSKPAGVPAVKQQRSVSLATKERKKRELK